MFKRYFAAITFLFGLSLNAQAVPITGLFNTGVDGSGSLLSAGATDTHYSIAGIGSAIVINDAIPGSWLANGPDSRWIWQQANGQPTNVTRIFETTFDLTGFDLGSVIVAGRCATDNLLLSLKLNGVAVTGDCDGFSAWTNYSLTSGFVSGLNTLAFEVNDFGVIAGFRNEFLRAEGNQIDSCIPGQNCPDNNVPTPSTIALLGLGLIGLALRRRKS